MTTPELSKLEKLKLYVEGWQAGASGRDRRLSVPIYAAGWSDGHSAFITSREQCAKKLDISVHDLLDVAVKS